MCTDACDEHGGAEQHQWDGDPDEQEPHDSSSLLSDTIAIQNPVPPLHMMPVRALRHGFAGLLAFAFAAGLATVKPLTLPLMIRSVPPLRPISSSHREPRDRPHCAGDGPGPVRAGSRLALGPWPEGVQRLRRSRAGPEDHFCEAVRNDLQVPLTVEGHPRTLSGPSPDLDL
jgi:hypothetical protein